MELKKIMLVDDSQPFNFLSRMTIRSVIPDCAVMEALNGKSALEQIARSSEYPQVVLLDINMPVMDGFEFLKELERKARYEGLVNVYMLTSSGLDEDRSTALASKFVKGYFSKPLTEAHIEEIRKAFS